MKTPTPFLPLVVLLACSAQEAIPKPTSDDSASDESSSGDPITKDPDLPNSPLCGDGVVEGDEICDGDNLLGATCHIFGYVGGGHLVCSPDCSEIITSECLNTCQWNGDCPREVPSCIGGQCWAGAKGDPCENPSQCSPSAPFCFDDLCYTGQEDSYCRDDNDCLVGLHCVLNLCYDGSKGDWCTDDGDCQSGSCDGKHCE